MKSRIHVNQHRIKSNKKNGEHLHVLSVKTYKGTKTANRVILKGPSVVVYSPDKPLDCGARVWIETVGEVILD